MASTVGAQRAAVCDRSLAGEARYALRLAVLGVVPREDVDRQLLVLLAAQLGDVLERFQLDEGLGAGSYGVESCLLG